MHPFFGGDLLGRLQLELREIRDGFDNEIRDVAANEYDLVKEEEEDPQSDLGILAVFQ